MKSEKLSEKDKPETIRNICKQLGLKLTHQRLEIFNMLASLEDHPSAEEIYERVKPKMPTISFDTVYRTLALFERHSVIARVQYLDNKTRYDSNVEPHYHLVCKRCKKIQDFHWPDLDRLQTPDETRGWGTIEDRYLELRGACQDCLASTKTEVE